MEKSHFTRFAKSPLAYRQYAPDDPVQSSIYDTNMDCSATVDHKNSAILLVDSQDRRPNEEPNKYSLRLKKVYRDVVMMELETANIPNSDYILNENNRFFYFQDSESQVKNDEFHTIALPLGNYFVHHETEDSIRSLLEDALNAINPANEYEVAVNPPTKTIAITQLVGSGVFNILFRRPKESACHENLNGDLELPNSMRQILGFRAQNLTGSLSYMAPYRYNPMPYRYIVLHVNTRSGTNASFTRVDSNNDGAQNAFCIIPFDASLNGFLLGTNDTTFNQWSNESYRIYFNPPLQELDRLDIEFRTPDGKPFNFRGQDHFMVFEIQSLSRHQNYHQ